MMQGLVAETRWGGDTVPEVHRIEHRNACAERPNHPPREVLIAVP